MDTEAWTGIVLKSVEFVVRLSNAEKKYFLRVLESYPLF